MTRWRDDDDDDDDVEETTRSYLREEKKRKEVLNPAPSGFDVSSVMAVGQHPLWLDGNQLIGGAQDWRTRGLEKKRRRRRSGQKYWKGRKKKLKRKTTWEAISVSRVTSIFVFRTGTEKKCMGKLFLCCHLAYFILRTLQVSFFILPFFSFFLSFLSLFYKSAPLPLISSPFTSSTTLFFSLSLSLFL